MRSDSTTLPPGYELDDYVIEAVLGQGGFGVTYRAHSRSLRTVVAIKEYFPQSLAMRTSRVTLRPLSEGTAQQFSWARDRFQREVQALALFRHPNIVRVARAFQANNTVYAVLDFEDGISLKRWFETLGRRPSQAELDQIIPPILDALEAIHSKGLIHRDVSPDNIIRRPDGSPVLIDFGAAKELYVESPLSMGIMVKHGFSPIEQYSGDVNAQGAWTDIYALAATIYDGIMGLAPPVATERVTRDAMRPAVELTGHGYRPGFLDALDWGLSVQPQSRPNTISDWRVDLFGGQELPRESVTQGWTAPENRQTMSSEPRFTEEQSVAARTASTFDAGQQTFAGTVAENNQTDWVGTQDTGSVALIGATEVVSGTTEATASAPKLYEPIRRQRVGGTRVLYWLFLSLGSLLVLAGVAIAAVPQARDAIAQMLPGELGCSLLGYGCAESLERDALSCIERTPVCDVAQKCMEPFERYFKGSGTIRDRVVSRGQEATQRCTSDRKRDARPSPDRSPSDRGDVARDTDSKAGPTPQKSEPVLPPVSGTLPATLISALSQFESCVKASPCNLSGCRRSFDNRVESPEREKVSDRVSAVSARADERCVVQKEESAFAELKACAAATPCAFDSGCLTEYNSAVSTEARKIRTASLDDLKRDMERMCQPGNQGR